jgi:hypothetical protein
VKQWKGIIETYELCEAETEEEAIEKMAQQLIKRLLEREVCIIAWSEDE